MSKGCCTTIVARKQKNRLQIDTVVLRAGGGARSPMGRRVDRTRWSFSIFASEVKRNQCKSTYCMALQFCQWILTMAGHQDECDLHGDSTFISQMYAKLDMEFDSQGKPARH